MKISKKINLILTTMIAAVIVCMFTIAACADVAETGREKNQKLMPGVWESTVYVTQSSKDNVRAHILKINKGSNVALKVSNASYYKKGSTAAHRSKKKISWGYANVTSQAKKYEAIKDKEGKVIAGINGDFYLKGEANGMTEGKMIIEGRVINPSDKEPFFAVLEDGTYDIREGTSDTSDVQEAIAGFMWVVKDGKNNGKKAPKEWDTVVSLGLTKRGDVIIVCVDGRESSSAGMTVYDLGVLMKKQGCTDAILLDCGGSASFVTKRSGDKGLKLRNVPNDGMARPVSSALLVVKRNKSVSKPVTDKAASSMKLKNTKLIKKEGVYYYTVGGKKVSGFRIINNQQYLFNSNGKGITKTITLGNTKYYYKKGKLVKTSDKKAGRVAIGFCGATNNGKNLMYAYHYGDKQLNIGLNPMIKKNNGKMENWTNVMFVPWMSEIRFIKSANIGKGVKNLGNFAFYISRNPFNQDAKKLGSYLQSVTLPEGMTTIGKSAIYNNKKLKGVTIPKSVKTINANAFAYNEKAVYTFKRTTPPKFGKNVFLTEGKKTVIKTPNTKKWKIFLKNKQSKKGIGFKGTIKYSK